MKIILHLSIFDVITTSLRYSFITTLSYTPVLFVWLLLNLKSLKRSGFSQYASAHASYLSFTRRL